MAICNGGVRSPVAMPTSAELPRTENSKPFPYPLSSISSSRSDNSGDLGRAGLLTVGANCWPGSAVAWDAEPSALPPRTESSFTPIEATGRHPETLLAGRSLLTRGALNIIIPPGWIEQARKDPSGQRWAKTNVSLPIAASETCHARGHMPPSLACPSTQECRQDGLGKHSTTEYSEKMQLKNNYNREYVYIKRQSVENDDILGCGGQL